jgi:hypothetical protein
MEDREYSDKEIDILIDFVKTSEIPEQNKQRKIDLFEAMRPEKKKEVQLATDEEVDAVLGAINPAYRRDPAKRKEVEKTAEQKAMDSVLDDICKIL